MYKRQEEIRTLMEKLTGGPIDESFRMFPPFYTDCGKNIHIGKNVFINCGCHFQDQGGIYIGDGALIGSQVVLATINHGRKPEERTDNIPAPIYIGKRVWVGSHATILPGVSVGDGAIVAAGDVYKRQAQERLEKHLAQPGRIDGVFGNSTKEAVIRFQQARKNEGRDIGEVDGVIGPKTWKILWE